MITHTISDHPVLCMGGNSTCPKIRPALKDIEGEILEKFIAQLMTELLQQGFTYAVNAFFTSSSGQMPGVVKADLVEER